MNTDLKEVDIDILMNLMACQDNIDKDESKHNQYNPIIDPILSFDDKGADKLNALSQELKTVPPSKQYEYIWKKMKVNPNIDTEGTVVVSNN